MAPSSLFQLFAYIPFLLFFFLLCATSYLIPCLIFALLFYDIEGARSIPTLENTKYKIEHPQKNYDK